MSAFGTSTATQQEDVYQIVRTAVENRQPIAAIYHNRYRLFCPHRLGRNKNGEFRVLCYQYGGDSKRGLNPPGSLDNWRCVALEKLRAVKILTEDVWQTAPNHSRPASCVAVPDVDADDFPVR